MKKLLYRIFYMVIGFLGTIVSCGLYGPPGMSLYGAPSFNRAYGTVKNSKEQPIPGIEVSTENDTTVQTHNNGSWVIYGVTADSILTFTDIDGTENGSYLKKEHTLTENEANGSESVDIVLKEE